MPLKNPSTTAIRTRTLALIGGGYWGKNLARNFNALGVLHTICDSNQKTLENFSTGYEEVAMTTSFAAVLSHADIDQVAIAAPAAHHFSLAKQALLAGKDVFVEKPLCLLVDEGQELVELANKLGRTLMVGHLLQYHPYVEKLIAMVHGGELGRLHYITSNRLNLGKIRQEENSLWSFAPHDVSVILGLAGGMPEQVTCHGASYLTLGVADTTLTQLQFPSGLRAHVYVSWLNPFKEQKLTVVGSAGMAVFDDTKPWEEKLVVYRDYMTWTEGNYPSIRKSDGEAVVAVQAEPLLSECQHFLHACSQKSTPRTDGAEGMRVLQVLKAAQVSLDSDGSAINPTAIVSSPEYNVHSSAVVDARAKIGRGTSIWHFSHISSDCTIGDRCNLGQNVFVAAGVRIGNNVKIQNNVSIYAGTTVEDDVFLGPSCVLTNVSNPRSQVNRRTIYEETHIGRGATIGANATIVCGITIGRYAFVAAGAVVTKDVPDYALVKGNPGKLAGWMSRHGHPLDFSKSTHAVCPESGLAYELLIDAESKKNVVRCQDISEDDPLPTNLAVGEKSYRQLKPRSSSTIA